MMVLHPRPRCCVAHSGGGMCSSWLILTEQPLQPPWIKEILFCFGLIVGYYTIQTDHFGTVCLTYSPLSRMTRSLPWISWILRMWHQCFIYQSWIQQLQNLSTSFIGSLCCKEILLLPMCGLGLQNLVTLLRASTPSCTHTFRHYSLCLALEMLMHDENQGFWLVALLWSPKHSRPPS